jgi:anti-sigma regulatory factor (Ser/Thr protein kinase)
MTRSASLEVQVEIPRGAAGPRLAREFLRDQLLRDHLSRPIAPSALADAELVVSELATNALVHGQGRIVLYARIEGDALWLEVVDEGTGEAPGIREQRDEEPGGWGLRIVDTLALSWGAYEGTTHVWAKLPLG